METNLYSSKNHRVYLPKDDSNPKTLGESRFFKGKFWKLQVMLGYSWTDMDVTQRGLSLFNVHTRESVQKLIDKLNSMGIEFKTDISEAGWHYRFYFSSKKKNLEIIDKEYANFYKKTIKEHKGFYRIENEIISKELKEDPEWYYDKIDDSKFKLI